MAIVTSYDGVIVVNAVDLSNRCKQLTIDDGQEVKDGTAMGDTIRKFRPGLGTPSITAVFYGDPAVGSVVETLRPLISILSTGFNVKAKKTSAAVSTSNPTFDMTAIIDGGLSVLDEKPGEIPELTVKFAPYTSVFTISTSSS